MTIRRNQKPSVPHCLSASPSEDEADTGRSYVEETYLPPPAELVVGGCVGRVPEPASPIPNPFAIPGVEKGGLDEQNIKSALYLAAKDDAIIQKDGHIGPGKSHLSGFDRLVLTQFCHDNALARRVLALPPIATITIPEIPLAASPPIVPGGPGPSSEHTPPPINPGSKSASPAPPAPQVVLAEGDWEPATVPVSQVMCTSVLRKNPVFEDGLSQLGDWEDEVWAQNFDRAELRHDSQQFREFEKRSTHIQAHHMCKKWERRLAMASETVGPNKENTTSGPVASTTNAVKKRKGKESAEGRKAKQTHDDVGPSDWAKRARM
ncbi:hypothetical protein QFC22_006462 [Naganishia vaughanmartiniae]|uniref:Uncharacterized protein n=1 Tax=Naganishia vaughanmartiniae TaxID=1424756 RepID=A0ACC2WJA0_9TREE|nr:hypothetical protein QFC22_006462 [Naganishia vaughanmartiniae]